MKFICLGYFDENQWDVLSKPEQEQFMETCLAYDNELRRGKHFIGGEALGPSTNAVTLRAGNGAVSMTNGPFTETREVLGGILLLEANDLNHAISLMSKHPGLKAGPFEIRAADETINQCIASEVEGSKSDSSSRLKSDMIKPAKNTICLWYDNDAEEAAQFYALTFPDSAVSAVYRAPGDYPSGKQGDVLTVSFTVMGVQCLGLNGGPEFKHNEAFSFQVATADQAETDRYWNAIINTADRKVRAAGARINGACPGKLHRPP
jgi:predicted 3-demethylubiquinone-9 3-methyltransferase (glyoxalase superfamily)